MASVRFEVDARQVSSLVTTIARMGSEARPAISRALNHTGGKATTKMARAIAKQAGLAYGKVKAALQDHKASPAGMVYRITAKGPTLSLKEFKPRQTQKGVSASPWGTRRTFPHSFIGGGVLGGHVYVRTSKARFPLKKLFGPAIPNEMVRDQSKQAFEGTVAMELPARLAHELSRILRASA